jgi:UDP-N-acetylmuramoyl-tripeptide--D-alanyl-D-alanine ligase
VIADVVVGVAAALPAGIRWLRVAQREHYLPGSVSRFGIRWWRVVPNPYLLAAVVASVVSVGFWWPMGPIGSLIAGAGPVGLALKGRTSPLAWTARLRRVTLVSGLMIGAAIVLAGVLVPLLVPLIVVLVPLGVDASLALLSPFERKQGDQWVKKATAGLGRSGARVVAITGSYGKTSTKVITAHLLGGVASTTASPASFNNRMGLARAINEGLAPGTEIFVAEMGTYGQGEIADLCSWVRPEVGVITAIGPVHLERMGSEEMIAQAKREILENARVGVLAVDHPLLARIADEEESRIRVVRCSTTSDDADVRVDPATGEVVVRGQAIGGFDSSALHASNVACAIGVVLALGFEPADVVDRLGTVPAAPNRQGISVSTSGFTIVDNTFNSNPAGARAALDRLAATGARRRVLVTPGMVELGPIQDRQNRELARHAAGMVTDIVVVGRTNRRPLVAGATEGGLASVIVKPTREEAVAWVRENLDQGDAVLYENDLPDHFP